MVARKHRWQISSISAEQLSLAQHLSDKFKIPLLIAKLLVQRGYTTEQEVNAFLYGSEDGFYDPYLLADMDKAVARIQRAILEKQKVRIYGDYDADGVSSTTLMYYTFKELGIDFDYYIPHRMKEGYGLNKNAIDLARQAGINLIVTVDTGISAYEEVEYAKSLGIDIVVTDHHEPPEQLPLAVAVVNPKQAHCQYPFKGLAGVGVAFKLATALLGRLPLHLTPVAALGTVADIMPLVDENRLIVRFGLQAIQSGEQPAFSALAEVSGVDSNTINSTHIGFAIAPRINAAGRLEHAKQAVELLIENDYDRALTLASQLDRLNKERQLIVEEMVIEAEAQWVAKVEQSKQNNVPEPGVIILAKEGWNVGVIGIVASKILEKYYKPVIVFGIDEAKGLAKGSARSIDGYDLHEVLTKCEHLLEHYGGHQAAAGMTIKVSNLNLLEEELSLLAYKLLSEEDWIPKLAIDLECKLSDITLETITQLQALEPFGMANHSPRIIIKDGILSDRRAIGKDGKHLKMLIRSNVHQLDIIAFGQGHYARMLDLHAPIEVVGELSINEWNNTKKPQLQLHDVHVENDRIQVFPTREQFGIIYQYIRKQGMLPSKGAEEILSINSGLPVSVIKFILDVFGELDFIARTSTHIIAASSPLKRDLASSKIYKEVKWLLEA